MRTRGIAVASLVLISCISVGMSLVPNAMASTLYVGGTGPGNYTSIQSAINAANPGDTVFVYSGSSGAYYGNLVISKSIVLIGEDKDSTIIDGRGIGTVIFVDAREVVMTDFTITNSGGREQDAAIRVDITADLRVHNSRISNSLYGVLVLGSGSCILTNNFIQSNTRHGIYFEESSGNEVSNNIIMDNLLGIEIGGMASDNIIEDNLISWNNGSGVEIFGSMRMGHVPERNAISGNTISHNREGIVLVDTGSNILTDNNFVGNDWQAHEYLEDIYGCPSNTWDHNFWSDYGGRDDDGDGIGETPYEILCTNAMGEDRHDNSDPRPRISPTGAIPIGSIELNEAILSGDDLENVHLNWSISPGVRSVIGFQVHRGSIFNAQGSGYQLTAFLPINSSTYTDIRAGEGNPGVYFYRVCALDVNNDEICATSQATKFTNPLFKGPNIISTPLIQSNESIEYVLQTVRYDKAWHYDSSSHEWRSYMKSKNYGRSLQNINLTKGVWINVTEESSFTVAGIVPSQTTIDLRRGWNIIGYPSFGTSFTVADLKAIGPVERVEAFDASAPPYFLRVLRDSDVLSAGQGYWVKTSGRVSWIVSNP